MDFNSVMVFAAGLVIGATGHIALVESGFTKWQRPALSDDVQVANWRPPPPPALTAEQLRYGHEGERWVRCNTCRDHDGHALYHPDEAGRH
jgi:hypothetical protein